MNRRMRAIAKRETIQILRDYRSLIVAIVLPILLLLLYGYGINLDVKHIKTAICDQDHSAISRRIIDVIVQCGHFDIVSDLDSPTDIDHTLDASKARVVVWIPRGFQKQLNNQHAVISLITDGSDSQTSALAAAYASGALMDYAQKLSIKQAIGHTNALPPAGVELRTRMWYNPELNSAHYIVPGLIAVILMLLSALLTSMTIVKERERGSYEQIAVSPIRPIELIIGKLIPYIVLAFADVTLVSIGGALIFGVPMRGNALLFAFGSLLFLMAALSLGITISSIAPTQLTAMMIAMTGTMVPTILLSGFVFPISAMPKAIQVITYAIPARFYLTITRGILLKGIGLNELWREFLVLAVTSVVLLQICRRRLVKRVG